MCGIVAAVSDRNVVPVLVQGLARLEYRGYDSCGVAVQNGGLQRARSTARVAELQAQIAADKFAGNTGIAHTRWATHGAPSEGNAHPHFSFGTGENGGKAGQIALVHNGIIENHDALRAALRAKGYVFVSQTDTEVIAHLIDSLYDGDLFEAVKAALPQLHGVKQITVVQLVHQMGDHLGVGLALEHIAPGLQPGAQFVMVFNDAVVHQRNAIA